MFIVWMLTSSLLCGLLQLKALFLFGTGSKYLQQIHRLHAHIINCHIYLFKRVERLLLSLVLQFNHLRWAKRIEPFVCWLSSFFAFAPRYHPNFYSFLPEVILGLLFAQLFAFECFSYLLLFLTLLLPLLLYNFQYNRDFVLYPTNTLLNIASLHLHERGVLRAGLENSLSFFHLLSQQLGFHFQLSYGTCL